MIENAHIRWFDRLSGQGLVRLESTQESVYIDWTAIVCPKLHGWDLQADHVQDMLADVVSNAACYVIITRDSHYTAINLCVIK